MSKLPVPSVTAPSADSPSMRPNSASWTYVVAAGKLFVSGSAMS